METASQISLALAAVRTNLHQAEIVHHIESQLNNPNVQVKLQNERVHDATQLAKGTIAAYESFNEAKPVLGRLGEDQQQWLIQWMTLLTNYENAVKFSLIVNKIGVSYFCNFDRDVVSKLSWDEQHFEEARLLITQYLNDPTGPRLEQDSSSASQRYTDNRRDVSNFQNNFHSFVKKLTEENKRAQDRLEGNIRELNAEIDKYNSEAERIKRALIQIAGIPSWMTWIISEILGALGLGSVEDARRALDLNYGEQQRLKDRRGEVQNEIQQKLQLDHALALANIAILRLNHNIGDINMQLDSFAKEWAYSHHDIVLIQQDMQAAADSATKRSLISRLKLMGSSIQALTTAMDAYTKAVEVSGLFK
ncbi:hypothetical protein NP233_g7830 [Leucocoprinus birnbaumii]|uniref:Uncharacterized protein n=1 Tax=Leucocoprinus birnbaumii TaxID=56174 RepID=A0AAD5VTY8_9AGAR|nr:hypothetical protein NP233_g7830 [Leucocoprinus birnbaumii]